MKTISITRKAFDDIRGSVGIRPAETGGILLGSRKDYSVQKFVFDPHGSRFSAGYDPDVDYLNKVVKEEWAEHQLAFLGFVHSHPRGMRRLSGDFGNGIGDLGYIRKIFQAMPKMPFFLAPIVFSKADGGPFRIITYLARRQDPRNYRELSLEVLEQKKRFALGSRKPKAPAKGSKSPGTPKQTGDQHCTYDQRGQLAPVSSRKGTPVQAQHMEREPGRARQKGRQPDWQRLEGAVDLDLLSRARIVAVGAGGASGLYEDLIRSGLGGLTVIDFDEVDATNLTTQGYDFDDIGSPKVKALGRRLRAICPSLNYHARQDDFLKLSEKQVEAVLGEADLLLFMTDNFHAQARGNRVALKLGEPALFAMTYYRARCAEITFTIPGITPACHRCAVSPRYRAYAQGYQNDVTSSGSTVFQTHYLNACLGLLALAILHRDTKGLEFSDWFGERFERNLLQIRMNPHFGEEKQTLFQRCLAGIPQTFAFDTIWQRIEPECPPKYPACPDCGGQGDLLLAAKNMDTTHAETQEMNHDHP